MLKHFWGNNGLMIYNKTLLVYIWLLQYYFHTRNDIKIEKVI